MCIMYYIINNRYYNTYLKKNLPDKEVYKITFFISAYTMRLDAINNVFDL